MSAVRRCPVCRGSLIGVWGGAPAPNRRCCWGAGVRRTAAVDLQMAWSAVAGDAVDGAFAVFGGGNSGDVRYWNSLNASWLGHSAAVSRVSCCVARHAVRGLRSPARTHDHRTPPTENLGLHLRSTHAQTVLGADGPSIAATHLIRAFEHRDYQGQSWDYYGDEGPCDQYGYRWDPDDWWSKHLSSIEKGYDSNCNKLRVHDRGRTKWREFGLSVGFLEDYNDNVSQTQVWA